MTNSTVHLTPQDRTPEQYLDTVTDFLYDYYQRRRWEIEQGFLGIQVPNAAPALILNSALADLLTDIARAAAGFTEHTEGGWAEGILMEGIQDLMERLFCPPGLGSAYDIPARFWETPLGQMVARALLWIREDQLITLQQAADLRGVTVQAISRAVQNGRLTRYVDPDAPARQGRTLVSRQEVEEQ